MPGRANYGRSVRLRSVRPVEDLPALDALFEVITECDGHRPIGEHKYLDLVHADLDEVTGLVGLSEDAVIAYAAFAATPDSTTWAAEFALHPLHRSRTEVADLVAAVTSRVVEAGGGRIRVWAFQPNLIEALENAGFVPERELRQLRRRLPVDEAPVFPAAVTVRGFRVGIDEPAWLVVNNAAFSGHPENGGWTARILSDREHQPWFNPAGLRMAWQQDQLLGFCWTKLSQPLIGEIYVIAVAPPARGGGLGRALVLEGLRWLSEANARTAVLYVDAGNTTARALYDRLGFRLDHLDQALVKELAGQPPSPSTGAESQPNRR